MKKGGLPMRRKRHDAVVVGAVAEEKIKKTEGGGVASVNTHWFLFYKIYRT